MRHMFVEERDRVRRPHPRPRRGERACLCQLLGLLFVCVQLDAMLCVQGMCML